MPSDYLPADLKRLWKELTANPVEVSPDELRREARKLRGGVRLRNSFVVGVSCFIIAAYGLFLFWSKTTAERIGALLSIAGGANVIVQFLRRPGRDVSGFHAMESIRFYRAELERHRDFHLGKGIVSWLVPFLPGPIVFNVAVALESPMLAPLIWLQMAVFLMIAAIVVPLNLSLARKYQRRIDALNTSSQQ
jgi:hypothetical protein